MNKKYLQNRDKLANLLVGKVPNVTSVGIGKKDGEFVLVVATNGEFDPESRNKIPESFHGMGVVWQDFGEIKLWSK